MVVDYENILVTGGAGFLGSNLCNKLSSNGKKITIFDNGFRFGFSDIFQNKENITLIKGDLLNNNDWEKIPKEVDFVFHLGAINGTKYFYEMPCDVLTVNVEGTMNMLKWISKTNAKGFFFASSSETYGFPKRFPTSEIEELSIPNPENPRFSYSGSKIIGEILSINFAKKYGISYHIGRFHNVYGPRMGFEHVIPEFIRRIVKNEEFIVQGDGTDSRCFCYIKDAIEAMILITKVNEAKNEIFNIGTQDEITINELIELLGQITQKEIRPVYKPFENLGTKRRVPDISKISKLGYTPEVKLKEGLSKTFDWYEKWFREN